MKSRLSFYPEVRKDYGSTAEIADVINKSISYVALRLNGKHDFTYRERVMLTKAVGRPETEANTYCRKEA